MTIPTNHGNLTENEIFSVLMYSSYATQRDLGMTHEGTVRLGIGNDDFLQRYEREKAEAQIDAHCCDERDTEQENGQFTYSENEQ